MKAKAKKARETRAAYRVRTRKARLIKPRTVSSRARKVTVVPWEKRIAPTDEQIREWDAWLNEHEPEFAEKYPGYYLAIWDKQVIAASTDNGETYRLADRVRPDVIPLVTYVPRPQDVFVVPSNFPVEWVKEKNV
ncbi:MAG: hypothetical protein KGJ80_11130 [Chloroflexota bacterium]|nr:hypothetical protein [Chloroflexota bacterium]